MKKTQKRYKFYSGLAAASLALLAWSCTDDLHLNVSNEVESVSNGLRINIPDIEGLAYNYSRAGSSEDGNPLVTPEDGIITSLWLCAFPTDSEKDPVIIPLEHPDGEETSPHQLNIQKSNDKNGYKKYTITDNSGNAPLEFNSSYKIYVFANLDNYLDTDEIKTLGSAEDAENLVLSFESMTSPFEQGELPMACLASNIKEAKNSVTVPSPVTGGLYTFTTDSGEIFADLTFLCTKVRYTIFFDNSTYSSGFGSSVIDFGTSEEASNNPHVNRIRKQTSVVYKAGDDNSFTNAGFLNSEWKVPLYKVHYPGDGNNFNVDTYPEFTGFNGTQGDTSLGNGAYNVSTATTGVASNLPKLEGSDTWEDNGANKRAWQGVVYLPENRQGSTYDNSGKQTTDYRTMITFRAQLYQGTGYEMSKDFILYLLPNKGDYTVPTRIESEQEPKEVYPGPGIYRSTLYDVVARITKFEEQELEISCTASEWTHKNLAYSLMSDVVLDVEATEISVKTGEDTPFSCSSNYPITFDGPKFDLGEETVDFYKFELGTDGKYHISVNTDEIPYSKLMALKSTPAGGKDENYVNDPTYRVYYTYFHVCAGNLRKKIKVDPLDLSPYLNVKPEEFTINYRDYYISGEYSGAKILDFDTNIDEGIEIEELEGYDAADEITYSKGLLSGIISSSGVVAWIDNYEEGAKNGKISINFDNMNSGDSWWTQNHDYKFRIKVKDPDPDIQSKAKPVIVKVHFRPYTTNYIIHFKDKTKSWSYPHIYVYQCLELPKDLEGNNKDYAGKTVGYQNGQDYLAALEYAFTNKLSFRGWKDYGGVENVTINDPNQAGREDHGFFIFNSNSSSYAPVNKNTTLYNYEVDFNTEHFANVESQGYLCEACRLDYININNPDHNGNAGSFRTWPGVQMEKEDDGWWKYTLTSAATPGKALIMFTDGHDNSMDIYQNPDRGLKGYRFPGNAEVGVPLFDFPDNEGWFLFDGETTNHNQNFTDDKPSSATPAETKRIYRFLWPKSWGNGIFMNLLVNGISDQTVKIAGWGSGRGIPYNANWYMLEFSLPESDNEHYSADIEYKIWEDQYGNNDPWGIPGNISPGNLGQFKKETDGKWYAYVTSIQDGESALKTSSLTDVNSLIYTTPASFTAGDKIVVNWNNNYGNKYFPNLYSYSENKNWEPWSDYPGYKTYHYNNDSNTVVHEGDKGINGNYPYVYVMPNNDNKDQECKFKIATTSVYYLGGLESTPSFPRISYNPSTRTYTVTLW